MGGQGTATGPPVGLEVPAAVAAASGADACDDGAASLENVEAELQDRRLASWPRALLLLRRAQCHRRSRSFQEAEEADLRG